MRNGIGALAAVGLLVSPRREAVSGRVGVVSGVGYAAWACEELLDGILRWKIWCED